VLRRSEKFAGAAFPKGCSSPRADDQVADLSAETRILSKIASTARERIRIEGGYRRDHLRALVQRVEVADSKVRIMGSKGDLLRTLAAASGAKSAAGGVPSSVLS
jgi:hypothetical protein